MARGWESKSVEAQQAEASEKPVAPRAPIRPEQAARLREREGLRLSSERIRAQLASTADPRYRKLLEDTLAELEGKLRETDE